ncbi:MAG: ABC transporter permease [Stellaceae bacterium]
MTGISIVSARSTERAASLPRRLRVPASLLYPLIGIAALLAIWWLGGAIIAADPDTAAFGNFAPVPAIVALVHLAVGGKIWPQALASLSRIGQGLAIATLIGVPVGIAIGRSRAFQQITHVPFQFLRMISPLAWMPIAVMAFATWDGAIIFLIAAATIWPVTFATANGLRKVHPNWHKVARNLGASPLHMLWRITLPAVAQDILTGVRLALGVAWIILVPAEFLGVTSGLGYAINDARDTLRYDNLGAIVLFIGLLGFAMDSCCVALIHRYAWHPEN